LGDYLSDFNQMLFSFLRIFHNLSPHFKDYYETDTLSIDSKFNETKRDQVLKLEFYPIISYIKSYNQNKPKCCIKYDADMLKNLCKATRFDYDTHDCAFNL